MTPLRLFLLLGCATIPRSALASPPLLAYPPVYVPPPPPAFTPTAIPYSAPSDIVVSHGQEYPCTVGGMRDYLETLHGEPEAYAKLDASLSSLETRRTVAWTAGLGSFAAGLTIAIIERPTAPSYDHTGALVGISIAVIGPIVAWVLYPGRGAIEDFIEEHNRINPKDALRPQVAIIPIRSGGVAALTWALP